ncbi:hypothetical protein K474DRAFT_1700686 [Panus rudis PR-1116 ss-1]|nr:hypothetical protein K474DRAFT_1700686 [Panus rudis PR-1116 ss-1]
MGTSTNGDREHSNPLTPGDSDCVYRWRGSSHDDQEHSDLDSSTGDWEYEGQESSDWGSEFTQELSGPPSEVTDLEVASGFDESGSPWWIGEDPSTWTKQSNSSEVEAADQFEREPLSTVAEDLCAEQSKEASSSKKRKFDTDADETNPNDTFSIQIPGGVEGLLASAPFQDAVESSFPAAAAQISGEESLRCEELLLPALVAARSLECDPIMRSQDPAIQAAIRNAMAITKKRKGNAVTSGQRSENIFADCNRLAPNRSDHLHRATEHGSVLPAIISQPTTSRASLSQIQPDHPLLHPPVPTKEMTWKEKRKLRAKNKSKKGIAEKFNEHTSESVQVVERFLVSENCPRTSTNYKGRPLDNKKRGVEKRDLDVQFDSGDINYPLLSFNRVPFEDPETPGKQPITCFYDAEHRRFAVRSDLPAFMVETILPELARIVPELMEQTVVSRERRENNNRGTHNITLYGFDRQNAGFIKIPHFEMEGKEEGGNGKVFWSIYVPGSILERLTRHVNHLVDLYFPEIAKRMKEVNLSIERQYGYKCPFGYFWTFCINSPRPWEGIHRVKCRPHVDAQNGALMVCAVFVYYYGKMPSKMKERIWLVLWEAGLIIEVPVGVVILYPSALFLHFNIDIRDLDRLGFYFTEHGEKPSPETLKPLSCENSEEGGRGSMVWFTQATMLQSADLPDGVHKMGQLKELAKAAKGHNPHQESKYSTYDAGDAFAKGIFPIKNSGVEKV